MFENEKKTDYFSSEVNLIKFLIVKTVCFVDLLSSLVNI